MQLLYLAYYISVKMKPHACYVQVCSFCLWDLFRFVNVQVLNEYNTSKGTARWWKKWWTQKSYANLAIATEFFVGRVLRLWRNTHWEQNASFDSLLSRVGLGHFGKEWIVRGTTYWDNGLFYPNWNRLCRFTAVWLTARHWPDPTLQSTELEIWWIEPVRRHPKGIRSSSMPFVFHCILYMLYRVPS